MSEYFRNIKAEAYVPNHGPIGEKPSPTLHALMGDEGVINMVAELYQRLEKSEISPMFKREFSDAVDRSASFFVQLLGGPLYFNSKYGPPKMRMRHLPFRINEKHRLVWLDCFYETLDNPVNFNFPAEEVEQFKIFLSDFSKWMVNTDD
ncbi:bacitracin resistance protein BacA [bacterium]|nr:bacitracin resistance protein BacA [bacterium]